MRKTLLLLALVITLLSVNRWWTDRLDAAGAPVFTQPSSNQTIPLSKEFARDVLKNAWDMSSAVDLDRSASGRYSGLTEPTFLNGVLSAQSTSRDPYFWLSWDITKPIDPSKFNRVALRMSSDKEGTGQIWWFTNESQSQLVSGAFFIVKPGWHTYFFDFSTHSGWTNSIRLLRVDPQNVEGANIQVDWVSLTQKQENSFAISWNVNNASGSLLSLYYATDPQGTQKEPIVESIPAASQQHIWDTTHLAPGAYYLFGYLFDENVDGEWFAADGALTVPEPEIQLLVPNSTGTTIAETDDYRTRIWQDPWDMANKEDLVQLDSPCILQNTFKPVDFSDGIWTGTANPAFNTGHWAFLLSPGYRGALSTGMDGQLRPIDPKIYTQLTIKMYISEVDPLQEAGARLFWTRGDIGSIGNGREPGDWGESNYIRTYSGWHIYSIDLTKIGLLAGSPGQLDWSRADKITGLRLDPAHSANGKIVKIDWIRLSPKANYNIAWNSPGISEFSNVALAVNSNDRLGWVPVHVYADDVAYNVSMPLSIPANVGEFHLDASLPAGSHQLRLSAENRTSDGVWNIAPAPVLQFIHPSPFSGEEYGNSTGDPWDFRSIEDVDSTQDIVDAQIIDGTYRASHAATGAPCSELWSDSAVLLRMGRPIDPEKYRYLTFRVRMEGDEADISNGWMSRITWYDADGFPNVGTSNDIINRAGWNTHTIDMWRADLPDDEGPGLRTWSQDLVTQLRIDVDEVPQVQTFYIDDVKLHAVPSATDVYTIAWSLSAEATFDPGNVEVSLGYDADRNGYDGTLIITGIKTSAYQWDVRQIPNGLYYIYALVSNGVSQSRFYSDAPVRVVAATDNVTFTQPDGPNHVHVQIGSEFARDILQNAWEMGDAKDIDLSDPSRYNGLTPPIFDSNVLHVTSTTHDPYFWLSWDINKPINSAQFNRISLRLYADRAGQGQIWWFTNETASRLIEGPKFTVVPGWWVYYFDMETVVGWNGSIRLLRIDPLDKSNTAIQVDWVRLSQKNQRIVTVRWAGQNLAGASVDLYYSTQINGTQKNIIAEGIPSDGGVYNWDVSDLPDQDYYLFGHLISRAGGGQWFSAESVIRIGQDTPQYPPRVYIPSLTR